MKKSFILEEIYRQNKHWTNQAEFFAELEGIAFKRKIYNSVKSLLSERQIISIVGLRRVGKTIILKQLIREILDKDGEKNVCFLTFDEAVFFGGVTLADYLNVYLKECASQSGRLYIFLDEIQYAEKWQHILKRYYDTDSRIKFIISGSSSLFLKKKTTESLAGRIYEFSLPVLSFEEFLELKLVDAVVVEKYKKYSRSFDEWLNLGEELFQKTEIFRIQYGDIMRREFEEYIKFGQFPEIVGKKDRLVVQKYLSESVYKKTLEYDIPKLFGVEKIGELKFIFQILVNEVGSIVELQNIAREVGIDEKTVKKYFEYFENSFLVSFVYNFSKSFRRSKRTKRKVYIGSTNFFSVFHDYADRDIESQQMGFLVENYVFLALKDNFEFVSFLNIRGKEVDFVAVNDLLNLRGMRYCEIKYRNGVSRKDLKFISTVAQKNNNKFLIFSKNELEFNDKFAIVPAWLLKTMPN